MLCKNQYHQWISKKVLEGVENSVRERGEREQEFEMLPVAQY